MAGRTMGQREEPVEDIFHGGGVAGGWLRSLDWQRRSMGRPDTWPHGLRTALAICLASRHPIGVLWGPEYLYFYNDAYAPIVGSKHPAALGVSFPDAWPRMWESDIQPMLASVVSSGEAAWV